MCRNLLLLFISISFLSTAGCNKDDARAGCGDCSAFTIKPDITPLQKPKRILLCYSSSDPRPYTIATLEYNAQGQLLRERVVQVDQGNQLQSYKTYEYQDNRPVRTVRFSRNGINLPNQTEQDMNFHSIESFRYEGGKLAEHTFRYIDFTQSSDTVMAKRVTYQYTSFDSLSRTDFEDFNNPVYSGYESHEYDSCRRKVKQTSYYAGAEDASSYSIYQHESNSMLPASSQSYHYSTQQPAGSSYFIYNATGRLIEMQDKNRQPVQKWAYAGNRLLEHTLYSPNGGEMTFTRYEY